MDDMQRVHVQRGKRVIHVETPLGIVNIYLGLHDSLGRRVETVDIVTSRYCGEPLVVVRGRCRSRLVELKTVKG